MQSDKKYLLGVLGAGNMAEAIVRGVIQGEIIRPEQIIAADPSVERRELFEDQLGVRCVEDNRTVAGAASVLLLCVKPYQMHDVLAGIAPDLSRETRLISIAAGISTKFIADALGGGSWHIVRAMPNTPMLVGQGMAALAAGAGAVAADLFEARRIFAAAATVIEVGEEKIDAVTAVSGSGPAYFFFLVEQMIAAGEALGLTATEARTLATATAAGAAAMMLEGEDSPVVLRSRVTTPNGTTHAAIETLKSRQWPQATIEAVKAAAQRSAELGK